MNPPFAFASRKIFAVAACAAVLLASFEDEVLLAVAPVAESAISSQEKPDPSDGFPDLFQAEQKLDCHAAPAAEPPEKCPAPPSVGIRPRVVAVVGPRWVSVRFCVWRV